MSTPHQSPLARMRQALGELAPDQRLAGGAAVAMFVSMFLPWYGESIAAPPASTIAHDSLTAFGAFSFVEAAVLLISAAVLWMLFARAERRAFHLPGGDGFVIMLAGLWAGALIFYRMLDTPSTTIHGSRYVSAVGPKWGIFLALAAAGVLAWAGTRIRAAHRPEPELADDPTVGQPIVRRRGTRAPTTRRSPPSADEAKTEQLSFEDEPSDRR